MLVIPFLSDPIVFVLSIAQPTPFVKRKMAAVVPFSQRTVWPRAVAFLCLVFLNAAKQAFYLLVFFGRKLLFPFLQ